MQYQVYRDNLGDLYMRAGWVWQISTGALTGITERGIPVTLLTTVGNVLGQPSPSMESLIPATGPLKVITAGGSGRNLILNADDDAVCIEWKRLPRVFQPAGADTWVSGYWTILKTSGTTAELRDQSEVIAEMATGTAPFGTYESFESGEFQYNADDPWSVDAIEEPGAPGNYPRAQIRLGGGTFPAEEIFESADGETWTFPDETAVHVVIDPADGSAELKYSTNIVATRAAGGDPTSPAGTYTATTYGETEYHSGDPWTAVISLLSTPPMAGWIYLKLSLSSGTITELAGPYLAASIPADTGTLKHIPIAHSDGDGQITQYHAGLLIYP
jgi:hypothetical protein